MTQLVPVFPFIERTPSGIVNGLFVNGDDGSGGIPLVWTPPGALIGIQEGAPQSFAYGALLAQPAPPISVFSFKPGFDPGNGWTVNAATGAVNYSGTGVVNPPFSAQLRAVRLGVTADSDPFLIQSLAAQTTDVNAPTIPTGLLVTIGGTASIPTAILSVDVSCDIKAASVAASGMKEIRWYKNGSLLTPVNATPVAAGLSLVLVGADIGVNVTPGSTVQTLSDYLVTGSGNQLFTATDDGQYAGVDVANDFTITCKLNNLTNAVSAGVAGICLRESTAADARCVYLYLNSSRIRVRSRLNPGNTPALNANIDGVTWPCWIQVQRTGDIFSTRYSLDGNGWISLNDVTAAFAPSLRSTLFVCSTQGAVTCVGDFRQLNIQSIARVSITDAAVAQGDTPSYTAKARDIALNESAAGAAVPVVIPTAPVIPPTGILRGNFDFSSGTLAGITANYNNPVVVTTNPRGGTYCLEQYVNRTTSTTKYRTEVSFNFNPDRFRTTWYGWSIFVPEPWTPNTFTAPNSLPWSIISQFHNSNAYTGDANPVFKLEMYPVSSNFVDYAPIVAYILGDDKHPTVHDNYQVKQFFHLGNITPGTWMDIVCRIRWDYRKAADGGQGFTQVYFNDSPSPIINYVGQNMLNDLKAPYLQAGWYMGWESATRKDSNIDHLMRFDKLAWGYEDEGVGYNTVAPTARWGPRPPHVP